MNLYGTDPTRYYVCFGAKKQGKIGKKRKIGTLHSFERKSMAGMPKKSPSRRGGKGHPCGAAGRLGDASGGYSPHKHTPRPGNSLILTRKTHTAAEKAVFRPFCRPSRAVEGLRLQAAARLGNMTKYPDTTRNPTLRGRSVPPQTKQPGHPSRTTGLHTHTIYVIKQVWFFMCTMPRSHSPCPATSSPPRAGGRGTSARRSGWCSRGAGGRWAACRRSSP